MRNLKRNKPNTLIPVVLITVGAILVIGTILWQVAQNQPVPTSAVIEPGKPTLSVEQVERVSLEGAKKAYDEKTAVIVDIRSAQSFAVEHIAGSINIPLEELGARSAELNKNDWIIPYCT